MLVSDDRDTVLKCGHMKWTSTREKGVGQNRRTDRVGWKGRAGARNDRFVLTIFGAIQICMYIGLCMYVCMYSNGDRSQHRVTGLSVCLSVAVAW